MASPSMQKDFELQPSSTLVYPSSEASQNDDFQLMRLGKRPLLKRSFGFMSLLGFSCSVLITWEGVLVTSIGALTNGGTAGIIWGYTIVFLGTLSTFIAIGELTSMAPVAGGQYHWVALMAPASMNRFLSYITAWVTIFGWQAVAASSGYLLAVVIQGIIALSSRSYVPQAWHTVLLSWSISIFAVVINSTTGRILARFEGAVLIVHLTGFFCVLIPLVYLGPHASAKDVFTEFSNGGGWSSTGLSFLVGMPGSVFALVGADSAVHMAEEIVAAAHVVPKAIVYSVLINGTLGWAMVVALVFCLGDLDQVFEATQTYLLPFIAIFYQAVNSRVGAALMTSIILFMGIASTVGLIAAASRMLWSFARDKGLPCHRHLVKLTKSSALPIYTILVTLTISMLLALIPLGSTTAFNNIVSLSVAGLYSSYFIVCLLLLVRRVRGDMAPYSAHSDVSIKDSTSLSWGPWRIPEPFGTINHVFACTYLIFLWFWTFWPPYASVTPQNMNFSILVFGATILFSVIWYILIGRKKYTGPIQEV